ncbi:MAG: metallophosphoesterase family protein, partial [Fusobacteriaceae bacterium]
MVIEFPIMSDYSNLFWNGHRIFATHGHHFNIEKLPPLQKGDILIHGHTHIPIIESKDGVIVMNPGSISLPKESSPHSYGIFKDNIFEIKNLEGELYKCIKF